MRVTDLGSGTSHRTKDGSSIAVEITTGDIWHEGRSACLDIARDVTERERANAVLLDAKEAAEAAARAKSEFFANMSHEIRTPMNADHRDDGLLLETRLGSDQREFVETIRQGSESLLTIINDILDFSKIESGKLELEKQPFSVRQSVEAALDLLAPEASRKNLEMAYMIDRETPTYLSGDVTRVRQILVNLLGNAVKFTNEGEVSISVKTRKVQAALYEVEFPCATQVSEFRKSAWTVSFNRSARSMPRQRASMAAQVWGWQSARNSHN